MAIVHKKAELQAYKKKNGSQLIQEEVLLS